MPGAFDHLFALVLAVLFPVRAALFGYRRLVHATPDEVPRVRVWLYRQGIAIQWLLTLTCAALWAWQRRPWDSLGVVPKLTWPLLGLGAGFAVLVIVVVRQRRAAIADDEAMAKVRHQVRALERMLPRSDQEMRLFAWLSVTAGICEEILYRGYLIWYLDAWLPLLPAVVIASAVFGAGHAYQGPRGIALTTGVGLVMSAVYLSTGSLLLCAVMHALMDIYSGGMARAAFLREPAAAASRPPDGDRTPSPPDATPAAPVPIDAFIPRPGAVTADDPEG
jgi:membrane protease YdiL (CAAX protease family)